MLKSAIIGVFIIAQAVVLLAAGIATLWRASDLMSWLIWLVGEEYALGPENVIHLENGGKLLTNPGAMLRWTLPFWFLGLVQITAAFTLAWLWFCRSIGRDCIARSPTD